MWRVSFLAVWRRDEGWAREGGNRKRETGNGRNGEMGHLNAKEKRGRKAKEKAIEKWKRTQKRERQRREGE